MNCSFDTPVVVILVVVLVAAIVPSIHWSVFKVWRASLRGQSSSMEFTLWHEALCHPSYWFLLACLSWFVIWQCGEPHWAQQDSSEHDSMLLGSEIVCEIGCNQFKALKFNGKIVSGCEVQKTTVFFRVKRWEYTISLSNCHLEAIDGTNWQFTLCTVLYGSEVGAVWLAETKVYWSLWQADLW